MSMIAQVGMGVVGGSFGGIMLAAVVLLWMMCVFGIPIMFVLWFLPEICELLCDIVQGRDVLTEHEQERQLEGRVFNPE